MAFKIIYPLKCPLKNRLNFLYNIKYLFDLNYYTPFNKYILYEAKLYILAFYKFIVQNKHLSYRNQGSLNHHQPTFLLLLSHLKNLKYTRPLPPQSQLLLHQTQPSILQSPKNFHHLTIATSHHVPYHHHQTRIHPPRP
jgi:hypothetical protein